MAVIGVLSEMLHSSGGLELCELEICRGLARRGWRVDVTAGRAGDLLTEWSSFADVSVVGGRTAMLSCKPRRSDVDLLYAHDPDQYLRAVCLGRELRLPVVAHLHLPPPVRTGLARYVRGRFRDKLDPAIFSAATQVNRFLTVSDYMRQAWTDAGLPASRVVVVHNGIDTARFRPAQSGERDAIRAELGLAPDELVYGYIGRLDPVKGIAELLEAFGRVRADLPGARLVVAGELSRWLQEKGSDYDTKLRSLAPAGVTWLSKRRDIERVHRSLDVLVVPSQWDEPLGLVALEALATGVPVLATRRGGLPEILDGELAQGLCGTSPRQLAAAMVRLGRDERLRRLLGGEGRATAERCFSIERMVDGVEAQLAEVAQVPLPITPVVAR